MKKQDIYTCKSLKRQDIYSWKAMEQQNIYTHTDEATRVSEGIIAIYSKVSDADWANIPQLFKCINEHLGYVVSVTLTGFTENNYEIFFIMDNSDSTIDKLEETDRFITWYLNP